MLDIRLCLLCTIKINVDSSIYSHQSVFLMGKFAKSNREYMISKVCLAVIVTIFIYFPQPIRSSSNYTRVTPILWLDSWRG